MASSIFAPAATSRSAAAISRAFWRNSISRRRASRPSFAARTFAYSAESKSAAPTRTTSSPHAFIVSSAALRSAASNWSRRAGSLGIEARRRRESAERETALAERLAELAQEKEVSDIRRGTMNSPASTRTAERGGGLPNQLIARASEAGSWRPGPMTVFSFPASRRMAAEPSWTWMPFFSMFSISPISKRSAKSPSARFQTPPSRFVRVSGWRGWSQFQQCVISLPTHLPQEGHFVQPFGAGAPHLEQKRAFFLTLWPQMRQPCASSTLRLEWKRPVSLRRTAFASASSSPVRWRPVSIETIAVHLSEKSPMVVFLCLVVGMVQMVRMVQMVQMVRMVRMVM